MSWDDIWRLSNALLAFVAGVYIAKNMLMKWRVRKSRMRLMSMALLALLLASAEGSLESIVRDIPPGPRTVLNTCACIWVLVAVLLTEDDYTERENETWPSQSSSTSTAPLGTTDPQSR